MADCFQIETDSMNFISLAGGLTTASRSPLLRRALFLQNDHAWPCCSSLPGKITLPKRTMGLMLMRATLKTWTCQAV